MGLVGENDVAVVLCLETGVFLVPLAELGLLALEAFSKDRKLVLDF